MSRNLLELAREVLTIEAEGIAHLVQKLDQSFLEAVDLIFRSKGRVILTGVGKSGIVARKLVATFNSTGTRALFLHPVEAMHGDLGMVARDDVVLALSNSGETQELTILLPSLKRLGAPLIAFTGRPNSTLGRASQVVIDTGVPREACPLGLAPTASTTAMLAMGDALAVALLSKRGFQASDFRRYHPGGNLGARLALAIQEVMLTGDRIPRSRPEDPMSQVIREMGAKSLGATLIVDNQDRLMGIITDGDLRRALESHGEILTKKARELMTVKPITVTPQTLASQALELMERRAIMVLPVVNQVGGVLGIVHLHDLLGRGEFKFTA
uniref:KpsF/GutQ family sugar-phosphate isomerase n=1 Tax=Desulfobacca acetoxidans TaxID=60893 RepID=A0A7C5EP77_9BACT